MIWDSESGLRDEDGIDLCTDLTCVPDYPPESTRADMWNERFPNHYQEDEPYGRSGFPREVTKIGFRSTTMYKPAFRGQLQQALERSELDEIDLDGLGLVIGVDKRLYEPRQGLIDCLAPVVAKGDPGRVYVNEIDWNSFPPRGELAYLFDEFFSKYNREVLMIVGQRRDGQGWLYHIPRQEGSMALVTWSATNGEMDWFSRQARWIGTIHIHPGSSCTPSTTDIDDWAEPEKTGLHVIFGRNGDYTINGAIAGRTFELNKGTLKDYARTVVEWTTSGRRPLNKLLLRSKPVKVVCSRKDWTHLGNKNPKHMPIQRTPHESANKEDFVSWMFNQGGMLKIGQEQLGSMRIVFYRDSYYIVTLPQWLNVQARAKGLIEDLPKAKRLSIYPVKGGRM